MMWGAKGPLGQAGVLLQYNSYNKKTQNTHISRCVCSQAWRHTKWSEDPPCARCRSFRPCLLVFLTRKQSSLFYSYFFYLVNKECVCVCLCGSVSKDFRLDLEAYLLVLDKGFIFIRLSETDKLDRAHILQCHKLPFCSVMISTSWKCPLPFYPNIHLSVHQEGIHKNSVRS